MSNPIRKAARAVQFRFDGPTPGIRKLRHIEGHQRWRLRLYLHHTNGVREERDVLVSAPCHYTHLLSVYEAQVRDLCQPVNGQIPEVKAGGFDAWILPPPRRHP